MAEITRSLKKNGKKVFIKRVTTGRNIFIKYPLSFDSFLIQNFTETLIYR